MSIGEKIKRLRNEKMMTQTELAGSEITRNMLSRIEHGVALPSLGTIRYLAARLNVSPGFLLADGEDEEIYLKFNEIADIKKSYRNGDFRICRDMCQRCASQQDDEVRLILAECDYAIAIEEFNAGNLHRACGYFDEAIENCSSTIYHSAHMISGAGVYFKYMRLISPSLSSNIIDEETINPYPAMYDDFCRYAAWFVLQKSEHGEKNFPPSLSRDTEQAVSAYELHKQAHSKMKEKQYKSAYELLHQILIGQQSIPEPMLYFLFCDLEISCKECADFKGAYEYANSKMALLQKLLD